jgi:hypothetical protein
LDYTDKMIVKIEKIKDTGEFINVKFSCNKEIKVMDYNYGSATKESILKFANDFLQYQLGKEKGKPKEDFKLLKSLEGHTVED